MKRAETRWIVGPGLLMEAGFLLLAGLRQPSTQWPLLLFTYVTLFLLMWGVFVRARNMASPLNRRQQILIGGFALLFRLTLLVSPPTLSDDIYRYGWEGRVQRAGFSPYNDAPSSPNLASLRGTTYERINHKDIPTIYPPLTQIVFRLGSYLGDGLSHRVSFQAAEVLSQKCIFLLFDVLSLAMVWLLLKQRGLLGGRIVLYAWNPLIILEFAGSGHNDSLGIFFLLAGLWLWSDKKKWSALWGSASFAMSFLAKYLSVLWMPYMVWKRRWKELVLFGALAGLGLIPFCACWLMTHGAKHYLSNWQFNGSVYSLLQAVAGPELAKRIVGVALVGLSVWVGKKEEDIFRVSYVLVAASLLLAPTVHPWYFTWLVPFLCVYPNVAFLVWNGTIVLSYTVWRRYALYHVWDLHPAVQCLEYIPVYALWVYEYRRHHSRV